MKIKINGYDKGILILQKKKRWQLLSLVGAALLLSSCSQTTLTQEDLAEKAVLEAQEKKAIEEKKTLSDFVNKAYGTTHLTDLPPLIDAMTKQMDHVTQETAVKMMLHLEMAQRIVLQNDVDFGEISPELSAWLASQPLDTGILSPSLLKANASNFEKELDAIDKAYMGIQKLGNRYYLAIDFEKYKQFGPKLSLEYNLYQSIMSSETVQPSVLDQKIQLTPTLLIQRLLKVDEFYRDHPVPSDGIIQNNMSDEFKLLMRLALYGTTQSSNWDQEGRLLPEWQLAISSTVFPPDSELSLPFEMLKQKLVLSTYLKTPEIEMQIQELLKTVNDLVDMKAQ